jgi:hypothetical protein
MTVRRSATGIGIPLYLIPQVITHQIHKQGEDVYHISVTMVYLHHFTITIRTTSPKRELIPGHARVPPSRHEPADNRDHVCSGSDSGDAP